MLKNEHNNHDNKRLKIFEDKVTNISKVNDSNKKNSDYRDSNDTSIIDCFDQLADPTESLIQTKNQNNLKQSN